MEFGEGRIYAYLNPTFMGKKGPVTLSNILEKLKRGGSIGVLELFFIPLVISQWMSFSRIDHFDSM